MKKVLSLGKQGMEVDNTGMKQAEAEDWRAAKNEGEGGSGLESRQGDRQLGK